MAIDPTKLNFNSNEVAQRLKSIQSYVDTNLPEITKGIDNALGNHNAADDYLRTRMPQLSMIPQNPMIEKLVSGNSLTPPKGGLNKELLREYNLANIERFKTQINQIQDPLKTVRPTSFDASRFGYNFNRYYEHPNFRKLGFSIYKDNESIYNENSSWLDDNRRMWGRYMSQAWLGASGLFRNWGEFSNSGEIQDAAQMETNLSIMNSSKKGFGAWSTNFLANTAYTFGIIAEIAAEELALAAFSAATLGAGTAVAVPRTAMNIGRLSNNISKMFRSLNKVSEAKGFYNKLQAGAEFLNPLERTTDFFKDALSGTSAVNRLKPWSQVQRGFGSFYRDLREINAVTAESRLEGGFVQNQVATELLDQFYKENGRGPTEKEGREIYERAYKAGFATTIANIPAIYVSNKIVLETALTGFKPLRKLLATQPVTNDLYKLVKNKDYKPGSGVDPFLVKPKGGNIKNVLNRTYYKELPGRLKKELPQKPGRAVGSFLRYFGANLMEGLQEVYQEGAQVVAADYYIKDYFADLYGNNLATSKNSFLDSLQKGIAAQFSHQGLDVFLSGFLMGGVVQPVQNVAFKRSQLVGMRALDYMKGTDKYEQYQKTQKEDIETRAKALNEIYKDPAKYATWLDDNVRLQRDLNDIYIAAVENDDEKTAQDAKDDSMFNHVFTLLRHGDESFQGFIDQLSDLKQLSQAELQEAFQVSDSDYIDADIEGRIDRAITKAKNIRDRYNTINNKFKNPFNPNLIDKKKDLEGYQNELFAYQAFEYAKKQAMFAEYTFDRVTERYDNLLNGLMSYSPLKSGNSFEYTALASESSRVSQMRALENEIKTYAQGSAEDKKLAASKQKQLEALGALHGSLKIYAGILDKTNKGADLDQIYELYNIDNDLFAPTKLLEKVIADVKDYYTDYIKELAKNSNDILLDSAIEKSLKPLLDLNELLLDAKEMAAFINILNDPLSIFKMAQLINNQTKEVIPDLEELIKKGLEEFKFNEEQQELYQNLLEKYQVLIPDDQIDELRDNDKLPEYFLDALSKTRIDESTDPKRYEGAINIFKEYEKLRSKTFSGKEFVKEEPEVKEPEGEKPPVVVNKRTQPFDSLEPKVQTEIRFLFNTVNRELQELGAEAIPDSEFEDWYNNTDDSRLEDIFNSNVVPTSDLEAKKADIERRRQEELLGKSFAKTTEKLVTGKKQSAGKTIVRFIESKISSDGEVLTIKPKAKFKGEDTSLTTTPETITVEEFREQFYENLSEQDKEMFDEFFTDDSTRIKLVEVRIGLKGNTKGQVNIDVESLEGQPFGFELQNGKEINAKYDAELAALEDLTKQEGEPIETDVLSKDTQGIVDQTHPDENVKQVLWSPFEGVPFVTPLIKLFYNPNNKTSFYQSVAADGRRIYGMRYKRVSDFKPKGFKNPLVATDFDPNDSSAADRGTYLDLVLRFFFNQFNTLDNYIPEDLLDKLETPKNKLKQSERVLYDSHFETFKGVIRVIFNDNLDIQEEGISKLGVNLSEEALDSLAMLILKFKKQFVGYKIFTTEVALSGHIGEDRVAGTPDFVLYKDGKFIIVDLKTSMSSRWNNKNGEYSSLDKKNADEFQLNAYADFLTNSEFGNDKRFSIEGLFILPLKLAVDKTDPRFITKITIEKVTIDNNTSFLIPVDRIDLHDKYGYTKINFDKEQKGSTKKQVSSTDINYLKGEETLSEYLLDDDGALKPQFKGTIIFSGWGTGKTALVQQFLDNGDNTLVDGDVILKQLVDLLLADNVITPGVKRSGQPYDPETEYALIAYNNKEFVLPFLFSTYKNLKDSGHTVLTGSNMFLSSLYRTENGLLPDYMFSLKSPQAVVARTANRENKMQIKRAETQFNELSALANRKHNIASRESVETFRSQIEQADFKTLQNIEFRLELLLGLSDTFVDLDLVEISEEDIKKMIEDRYIQLNSNVSLQSLALNQMIELNPDATPINKALVVKIEDDIVTVRDLDTGTDLEIPVKDLSKFVKNILVKSEDVAALELDQDSANNIEASNSSDATSLTKDDIDDIRKGFNPNDFWNNANKNDC